MAVKRVRRSKDVSRQAILEAAERLLVAEGPEGVRVQRVAAAVGLTDAAVHYHFGSRAGLMEALLRHSGQKLVAAIEAATDGEGGFDLAAVSRAMRRTYEEQGAARMAMWLKLAGWRPRGRGMLSPLIGRAHEARRAAARRRGAPEPSLADTQRLIALFNAAHLAMAVMGEALLPAADLPAGEGEHARFLQWTTRLLEDRLSEPEP